MWPWIFPQGPMFAASYIPWDPHTSWVYLGYYVPRVLFSQVSVFPRSGVSNVLCTEGPVMVLRALLTLSPICPLYRDSKVPTIFCLKGPTFSGSYVPRVPCSQVLGVPECYVPSIFAGFYIPTAHCSQIFLFKIRVLCSLFLIFKITLCSLGANGLAYRVPQSFIPYHKNKTNV